MTEESAITLLIVRIGRCFDTIIKSRQYRRLLYYANIWLWMSDLIFIFIIATTFLQKIHKVSIKKSKTHTFRPSHIIQNFLHLLSIAQLYCCKIYFLSFDLTYMQFVHSLVHFPAWIFFFRVLNVLILFSQVLQFRQRKAKRPFQVFMVEFTRSVSRK